MVKVRKGISFTENTIKIIENNSFSDENFSQTVNRLIGSGSNSNNKDIELVKELASFFITNSNYIPTGKRKSFVTLLDKKGLMNRLEEVI